jgi:hypothetical protein
MLSCVELSWVELSWVELCCVELCWVELSCVVLLCCVVLCYVVLCCVMLCCVVLCCVVLCCVVLCCVVLCCVVLCCVVLCCELPLISCMFEIHSIFWWTSLLFELVCHNKTFATKLKRELRICPPSPKLLQKFKPHRIQTHKSHHERMRVTSHPRKHPSQHPNDHFLQSLCQPTIPKRRHPQLQHHRRHPYNQNKNHWVLPRCWLERQLFILQVNENPHQQIRLNSLRTSHSQIQNQIKRHLRISLQLLHHHHQTLRSQQHQHHQRWLLLLKHPTMRSVSLLKKTHIAQRKDFFQKFILRAVLLFQWLHLREFCCVRNKVNLTRTNSVLVERMFHFLRRRDCPTFRMTRLRVAKRRVTHRKNSTRSF